MGIPFIIEAHTGAAGPIGLPCLLRLHLWPLQCFFRQFCAGSVAPQGADITLDRPTCAHLSTPDAGVLCRLPCLTALVLLAVVLVR